MKPAAEPSCPGAMKLRPMASMRAALIVLALGACGYQFAQRYVAKGGAERVHVRVFENRSAEPDLGAAITAALRAELAQRGADAGEDAQGLIEGEVRASAPQPTSARPATVSGAATNVVSTWRIGLEVRARLVAGGAPVTEHVARLETDFLAGNDPLETEGRRQLALRHLASEAAREVLRAFER
jgi:hypothetical protein